ncbi:nucleolar RNA helicase 2-like [Clavelina lepadiformis]|uniref:RNA helicase n=1 Tax=Clavelina lepadiformis TaxID=159417 RepID=A0ABP0F5L1_CLALP
MVELIETCPESPQINAFVDEENGTPKKKTKISKKSTKTSKKKKLKKVEPVENGVEDEEPPKKKKKSKTDKVEKKKVEVEPESDPATTIDENSPEVQGAFDKFRITQKTQELLIKKGIHYLFPIQIKTFDHVYDGVDLIAQARTGTGKTMSFAIPLVEKLLLQTTKKVRGRPPKVLAMAPTRELAIQVHKDFQAIAQSLATLCVYGGSPYYPQESAMRNGLDIVVGTPGRILDHLKKGNLKLNLTEHVVLDEVDQMLDMGFAPTVEEILQYAFTEDREKPPQTLLFSATCPSWVHKTARKYMRPNETEQVDTIGDSNVRTAVTVEHLAIRCHYKDRANCIGNVVQLYSGQHGRAMIFTDTKKEANELSVCESLQLHKAQVLHGDIEQRQREITLQAYRDGNVRCLVATNVAARGLDIPEIDLVIQTSPPQDIESYIHRSGRTGRAGRNGVCVCFYKPSEDDAIRRVERTAGIKFKRVGPPQPQDIVKASINDAVKALDNVDKGTIKDFMEHAKTVAEKYDGGAVEALAAALLHMSGASKLQSRSLLNSQEKHTTWHFESDFDIRHAGFVFSSLEKYISRNIRDLCQGLRLTADGKGAVFDLPDHCKEEIESNWVDSESISLKRAETLPELQENSSRNFQRSNGWGSRGNNRGYRGQQSNRNGGGGGWRNGATFRSGNNNGGGFKRKWGK